MDGREWAREMALYGKWQNEALYRLCDGLTNEARQEDRGMFFGSIHRTLDHILMVDRYLLHFAETGKRPGAFDPNGSVAEDFAALCADRRAFDDALVDRTEAWSDDWLEERICFESPRLPKPRNVPRTFLLSQMFNHATHHRSQATAELHRLGIDYGVTDLPFNPLSQY